MACAGTGRSRRAVRVGAWGVGSSEGCGVGWGGVGWGMGMAAGRESERCGRCGD